MGSMASECSNTPVALKLLPQGCRGSSAEPSGCALWSTQIVGLQPNSVGSCAAYINHFTSLSSTFLTWKVDLKHPGVADGLALGYIRCLEVTALGSQGCYTMGSGFQSLLYRSVRTHPIPACQALAWSLDYNNGQNTLAPATTPSAQPRDHLASFSVSQAVRISYCLGAEGPFWMFPPR